MQEELHPSILWARDILSHPHVALLDTETTGLDARAEVIEIALIDTAGRVLLNTLIECQQPVIPQKVIDLHHIDKQALRGAPTFPQVWKQLAPLLEAYEIVIYNAEFDLRLLKQTARRYGTTFPPVRSHCLMHRFSAYLDEPSPYGDGYRYQGFGVAYAYFQIERTVFHRALEDTQIALDVLRKLAALTR